jgi:cholesterol 7-desaturase
MFYRNNNSHNTGLEVPLTLSAIIIVVAMALFSSSLPVITPYILLVALLVMVVLYFNYQDQIRHWVEQSFILQYPMDPENLPSRIEHDRRRFMTYPPLIPNSWYVLCDSDELPAGKVKEVRALNKVYVVWRGLDNEVVIQDGFCLHQGANLGLGGRVTDENCLQCPFHCWKFDKEGKVYEIPYNKDPKKVPTFAKLKTYPSKEWCGLICVYFHADNKPPEFELPDFVPKELETGNYKRHLRWNAGFRAVNVIDLVDQVCDHAHFNLLHGEFMIPWTLLSFPEWIHKLIPVAINHTLTTFIGDDHEWQTAVQQTGWGAIDKHLVYLYDTAGITWNGKLIEKSLSPTIEMFAGPSMIVFNIPVEIGSVKLFLSFLPVEGGCLIRTRTHVDEAIQKSWWKMWIAWIVAGIAASQFQNDLRILHTRIRPRRPLVQPTDGPVGRIQAWLKIFYSESSQEASTPICGYHNDW